MPEIPDTSNPIVEAIDQRYVDRARSGDSHGINVSQAANACDRALWLSLHWASPEEAPSGKRQRIFKSGEIYETRLLDDLRLIGCDVLEIDEDTGSQMKVSLCEGHLRGKIDGRVSGLPGDPKDRERIVECKSSNEKAFKEIVKKGVREGKFEHFVQLQLYLHGLGYKFGLYMVANKNTDEIHVETVDYDPAFCVALVTRLQRIIDSARPPQANESFACAFCTHKAVCQEGAFARVNCRTCIHSTPQDGPNWTCAKHVRALTYTDMQEGCGSHRFIPELVPAEQIDADPDAETITYRLPDGALWVDGGNDAR